MLVTLDAPYADTTAAELSLALGGPELPALHVLDLVHPDRPGVRLRLRLLGASHQVVLRRDGDPLVPSGELVETVACLPGRQPELPAELADPVNGYRFAARVLRLDPAEMSARTAVLRRDLADDPYALIGVFPGGPEAITALRLHRDHTTDRSGGTMAIGWSTWHAYPQSGELVETETVVSTA
ncbi:DUF2617 family protein [Micromonospora sp. NBC_01699]|uniref:DUF2617 family protein n=1 Tax=Micromonospora sp. NBC_01699 TaxID=2975984 RepID=UPI002E2AF098|nr:DUF2617 family protein [Micromonospora sp. NBC_01699]